MRRYVSVIGLASVLLAGCATVPADRGRNVSDNLIKSRSTVATAPAAASADTQRRIDELLQQPLDADAAVRVALLNNPRMQKLYAELGVAQSELYDVSRLANPNLGFARLTDGDTVTKTAWSVSQRITELLFLHFNTQVSRSQVLQTQQRVANAVLQLEAEVRTAYYQCVGAGLIAQMRVQMAATASASALYAEQLHAAGNISQLQLSREQAAASAAVIEQRKADARASAERGVLATLLGVPVTAKLQLVERLPLPSPTLFDTAALQALALQQRLDLAATREALRAAQLGQEHTQRWRWLGNVEVGVERERDIDGIVGTGPSASLELPLFNQGGGAVLRSRARVESLTAELQAMELATTNDIATQISTLRQSAEVVEEYRQQLMPLQQQIVQLSQLHQNFMLIGAFELLSAKQQELNTYQAYLESIRDYWIAHTELWRTAGGRLPDAKSSSQTSPDTSRAIDATSVISGDHP